ncbi:MAG: phospho-sugar mutase [Acidimicrobiia bacterium]|nr:phospho-sugar mutase [Acidimicrobiia bacterium]
MNLPEPLAGRVAAWLAADPDPRTRAELQGLLDAGDVDGVTERFGSDLSFGTSGLRAPIGAGPTRINRLVARQVAAGLAEHLRRECETPQPMVIVGHDARHGSADFAAEVAGVLRSHGAHVVCSEPDVPTPVVVWTHATSGADASVVCTASHNPPSDNGMKIYLADALQPVPPEDERLAARIASAPLAAGRDGPHGPAGPYRASDAAPGFVDAYVEHVAALVPEGPRGLRCVYTPLHGVAWPVLCRCFEAAGFPVPDVVATQRDPHPGFPTVVSPNPEEPGVLAAAVQQAARSDAEVVLANDPDGDRLALVAPIDGADPGDPTSWRQMSGNELGLLLADHLLRRSPPDADRLVVTAFETSRAVARLATASGARHVDVPTGFKWIMRRAVAEPGAFVFGCEEAIGYAVDAAVPDKDGIAAAVVVAALVAELSATGHTVWDRLAAVDDRIGCHRSATRWTVLTGVGARTRLAGMVDALRRSPPTAIGGRRVEHMTDLTDGSLGSPVDALVFDLADGARLVVRPSGTEPKVKVYAEVVAPATDGGQEAAAAADELAAAALRRITDGSTDQH